jgi:hypothetical protein
MLTGFVSKPYSAVARAKHALNQSEPALRAFPEAGDVDFVRKIIPFRCCLRLAFIGGDEGGGGVADVSDELPVS